MLHGLRKAFELETGPFAGPIEVDETYIGGKRKNMSNAKRKEPEGHGRGTVGKVAVLGGKDRDNIRELFTVYQMASVARSMAEKPLKYRELIA